MSVSCRLEPALKSHGETSGSGDPPRTSISKEATSESEEVFERPTATSESRTEKRALDASKKRQSDTHDNHCLVARSIEEEQGTFDLQPFEKRGCKNSKAASPRSQASSASPEPPAQTSIGSGSALEASTSLQQPVQLSFVPNNDIKNRDFRHDALTFFQMKHQKDLQAHLSAARNRRCSPFWSDRG